MFQMCGMFGGYLEPNGILPVCLCEVVNKEQSFALNVSHNCCGKLTVINF